MLILLFLQRPLCNIDWLFRYILWCPPESAFIVGILQKGARIATQRQVNTFNQGAPVVMLHNIGSNMSDGAIDAFFLRHLSLSCISSRRDFSFGIRLLLFFVTILKFLGTSAIRDSDCSAARI